MPIRKGDFKAYVRKIENTNFIEDLQKIERMIIQDLGGNPDTWTLDFYDPLIDLVYKKRSELENMSK